MKPISLAVSIGMVKEAELSRNLGHLSQSNLGRLIRCLQVFLHYLSKKKKGKRKKEKGKSKKKKKKKK